MPWLCGCAPRSVLLTCIRAHSVLQSQPSYLVGSREVLSKCVKVGWRPEWMCIVDITEAMYQDCLKDPSASDPQKGQCLPQIRLTEVVKPTAGGCGCSQS